MELHVAQALSDTFKIMGMLLLVTGAAATVLAPIAFAAAYLKPRWYTVIPVALVSVFIMFFEIALVITSGKVG